MEDRARIAKIFYRQAVMITLSFFLSVFIYAGVGFYAIQTGHPPNATIQGTVYRLLQLGAVIAAVLAMIGARFLTERMLTGSMAGASGNVAAQAERHPKQLYVTALIRSMAAEMPVILGLVLLFLSRDILGFIPFAIFALAALVFSFPNKQKWVEWLGGDF